MDKMIFFGYLWKEAEEKQTVGFCMLFYNIKHLAEKLIGAELL